MSQAVSTDRSEGGYVGSGAEGIPDEITPTLRDRFGTSRFEALSKNGAEIRYNGDGKVHVGVYSEFVRNLLRGKDGEQHILDAVNGATSGGYREVVYSIDPSRGEDYRARLDRESPKSSAPSREEQADKRRAEAHRICSPFSYIDHPLSDDVSIIPYAGNMAATNAIRGVFQASLEGIKLESPLVLRGPNGLGKSLLAKLLLRDAKNAGIPAVGCRVDDYIKYLRPDSGNLFAPDWHDPATKHAKLLVLDQFHTLYKWGRNKAGKTGYYLAKGTAQRLFELIEGFDGNVVIPFTDIPLEFEDFTDKLTGGAVDIYGAMGHRDFGVRLKGYDSVEVKYPSLEDQRMLLGEFIAANSAFVGVDSPELLAGSFVAANYRRRNPVTLRDMVDNVRNVACAADWNETGISPELVIDTVGTRSAQKGYRSKGQNFVQYAWDRMAEEEARKAEEEVPENDKPRRAPRGVELDLDSGYCGKRLLPAAQNAAIILDGMRRRTVFGEWVRGGADSLLEDAGVDTIPMPLFEEGKTDRTDVV